ncbi:hypothetical protein [Janthinobacterium sp. ZB1P44]|uniref:hypothetical protein n=1 Tax=Janthinobacterium sp. ZB1P44 TaxID=3424192 RepID=UPI003F234CDB
MKSISEILETLDLVAKKNNNTGNDFSIHAHFVSPTLHIDVVNDMFNGSDSDIDLLQDIVNNEVSNIEPTLLRDSMGYMPLTINPISQSAWIEKKPWVDRASKSSWISAFLNKKTKRREDVKTRTKILHFYGYKGGQGRSSVLALLAKNLADDGHRVLLLDADLEAPSLDLLFDVAPSKFSNTLMGLCGWSDNLEPLAGVYTGRLGGQIDLIACRPRNEISDLDFALLVSTAPIDIRIFERAGSLLNKYLSEPNNPYDIVLVDHRTGVASSVLPLIHTLAGSAVIFARTDMNISSIPSELKKVVRSIFAETSSVPGAFVSFSLDPNKSASAELSATEARTREALLYELADVIEETESIATGIPQEGNHITTNDLALNWIDWYLDRAMLASSLPDVSKLQNDNINSLRLLREALDLPLGRKITTPVEISQRIEPAISSLSGAKDSGQFIHIPELDRLFVPGNSYSYILGRKGTGKTRLLKEMANRRLGYPLLVANDETSTIGLRSKSIEANSWLERCNYDAPTFWWSLLRIRIESVGVGDFQMESRIKYHIDNETLVTELASKIKIKDLILELKEPLVLLVDGLETLVPASNIKDFVIALFDMLGTIQNDPSMASKLMIRSFIREDLAADSVQNIEQQLEGRNIRLKWSATSILNFALSRLPLLSWIGNNFKKVCEEIISAKKEIERSGFDEQQATELMLRVFPTRLRRNNLSTATFLRLYFSDAGGDDTNKGTFYPRLYLSFLQKLDKLASESDSPLDADGRITSALLNRAYDDASNEFIEETKQELAHLLSLEYSVENNDEDDDATKVSKFITAFAGLSTPFLRDVIVTELTEKTGFTEKSVRESLQRMKAIRMFEDRPGFGGWWRVGQLYKMGLMMKYVRSTSNSTN